MAKSDDANAQTSLTEDFWKKALSPEQYKLHFQTPLSIGRGGDLPTADIPWLTRDKT